MRYSKSDRCPITCVTLLMVAWSVAGPQTVSAQSPQDDVLRELRELRSEVQRLRAEVDALKGPPAGGAVPGPQLEILQTQLAELAQVKVESTTRFPVKLFGTVHAGVFANSGTANWLDNPTLVPATPADGHAGTLSASARQTGLGVAADGRA